MVEHATEHLNVGADPQRCWEVALDFPRYPEWAADVKDAQVLERDTEGRGTRVAFRAAAMGRSASYVLAYDYSEAPRSMSWHLVEGDIMRALDGTYVFETAADGTTDMTYHLAIELIVPIPGFVKRRAEGKIIGTALRELKRRVESLKV